jgi:hypothetical protein
MIVGLILFLLGIYLLEHGHPAFACCAFAGMVVGLIWPGWWLPR